MTKLVIDVQIADPTRTYPTSSRVLLNKKDKNVEFTLVDSGADELSALGYSAEISPFGELKFVRTIPARKTTPEIEAPALPGNDASELPGVVRKPKAAKAANIADLCNTHALPASYKKWIKENYTRNNAFKKLKAGVPALTEEQWDNLSK